MDRKEAIERIQEVMTIIRTQHMCKDMDGECTTEDRETYIQRFEALRMAIEALQEQERKKGCWKRCHKYEFGSDKWGHRCSECGHEISDDDSSVIKNFLLPNFCEFCGADMRGEEE